MALHPAQRAELPAILARLDADAHRFYASLGCAASHEGFKPAL